MRTFSSREVALVAVVAFVVGFGLATLYCELADPPETMTLVDGLVVPEANTTTFIMPDSVDSVEISLEKLSGTVSFYATGNQQYIDAVSTGTGSAAPSSSVYFTDMVLNENLASLYTTSSTGGSMVVVDVDGLKGNGYYFITIIRQTDGSGNLEMNSGTTSTLS